MLTIQELEYLAQLINVDQTLNAYAKVQGNDEISWILVWIVYIEAEQVVMHSWDVRTHEELNLVRNWIFAHHNLIQLEVRGREYAQ